MVRASKYRENSRWGLVSPVVANVVATLVARVATTPEHQVMPPVLVAAPPQFDIKAGVRTRNKSRMDDGTQWVTY